MRYTVSRKEIPEADGLSLYAERQQAEGFPQKQICGITEGGVRI